MTTAGVLNTDVIDRDDMQEYHAPTGSMVDVAQTRAAQEVQAAMIVAKKFPRDETAAYNRIMQACKRRMLAEQAVYAYPRGGTTVTGPSIRLAEVLAQSWGNLDFGIIELDQRRGESDVMAYAWDLETNVRQTKIFTVKHERHKKGGKVDKLTDPRDIYEMSANQGARRLRACILGVIPGDVTDAAVQACDKTLAGGSDEPLQDRVRKMVAAFSEHGVSLQLIEGRLGHKIGVTAEAELVSLRKIYLSIRDNMAEPSQFFDIPGSQQSGRAEELNERLRDEAKEAKEAKEAFQPEADGKGKAKPNADAQSTASKQQPETAETAASDETQDKPDDAPRTLKTIIGSIAGGKGKQPYTISTADGDFTCTKVGIVNTISKAKGDRSEVEATLTVVGDLIVAVEMPE